MAYARLTSILLLTAAAVSIHGQRVAASANPWSAGSGFVSHIAATTFVNVPFLPKCMMISMKQGDPRKGPSVTLARIASGCVIPWHWHTSNTRLILVSGHVRHMTKDTNQPTDVYAGDLIYLPARHLHWARCISTCLTYNISDARDVAHWVDRNGKDIPLMQAVKLGTKP
jgi:quercetin dioxygenase-like cupin family protein